ncbi:hypothetical protein V6N12_023671 [Hibiscus sabdariffa]|uniref:RNase H type-1 domain-containing protein n=1 Tax=Hibiscus sabdariffa TaxID=183260 RepID=A0ABR2FYC4_9ROSI
MAETDGSVRRGSSIATWGGVIRDDEGRWQLGFAKQIELIFCPWEVRLQHVRTYGNILADLMVKMTSESDLIICRFLDPPFSCRDILEEEAVRGSVSSLV